MSTTIPRQPNQMDVGQCRLKFAEENNFDRVGRCLTCKRTDAYIEKLEETGYPEKLFIKELGKPFTLEGGIPHSAEVIVFPKQSNGNRQPQEKVQCRATNDQFHKCSTAQEKHQGQSVNPCSFVGIRPFVCKCSAICFSRTARHTSQRVAVPTTSCSENGQGKQLTSVTVAHLVDIDISIECHQIVSNLFDETHSKKQSQSTLKGQEPCATVLIPLRTIGGTRKTVFQTVDDKPKSSSSTARPNLVINIRLQGHERFTRSLCTSIGRKLPVFDKSSHLGTNLVFTRDRRISGRL
ncbi:hypothetical protein CLF_113115 [Clonorchis sinensis]|uniref:Uncharacterized protein n=1 Tax=Clonorchis sinensis TaxID=79923 RepID=G7YXN4_CLOSI|nr:hypothetical protein CLF_113115 [Clonorchis sinensis]